MGQRRFFQDLESGDFQVSFDPSCKLGNSGNVDDSNRHPREPAFVDDQVSKITDPQSIPSPDRQISAAWSPTRSFSIKHPLKYIRNKVGKKILPQQHYHNKAPRHLNEQSNLLGRFRDTKEEEEEVLPSPTFFLSSRNDEEFVFEDTPRSGILTQRSSSVSSSYSKSMIPGAPKADTPYGHSWTCGYVFLIGYLLLGASAFYSDLQEEEWTFVDALYACLMLVATIGYPAEGLSSEKQFFWTAYAVIGSSCLLILALLYVMQRALDAEWAKQQACQATVLSALNGLSTTIPTSWNFNNGLLQVVVGLWLPFVIAKLSGWSVADTVNFSVHNAYTIGQDEVHLTTQPAKILAILWIPLAVGSVFQGLTGLACYFFFKKSKKCASEVLECILQELQLTDVVSRAEFLEMALISMNQVDPMMVVELRRQYDAIKSRAECQTVFHRLVETRQRNSA